MGGQSLEESVEGFAGEAPVEGFGGVVVAILEGEQPVGKFVEVVEVLGFDDLALHDGEEDLHLVEPTGVHRRCTSSAVGHASRIGRWIAARCVRNRYPRPRTPVWRLRRARWS